VPLRLERTNSNQRIKPRASASFPKNQTISQAGIGPRVTVDVAFNHHAARVVQAGFDDVIVASPSSYDRDQVGVWFCS